MVAITFQAARAACRPCAVRSQGAVIGRSRGAVGHRPLRRGRDRGTTRTAARSGDEGAVAEKKLSEAPDAEKGGEAATGAAQLLAKTVASPVFYLVAGLGSIYLLSLTGETVGPVVVFSALPVVGLTLLSKSDIGKQVQSKLEEELPELEANAVLQRKAWSDAIAESPYFGADRSTWPGLLGGPAAHLTGEVAGDFGFDPLGLAKEPGALAKYRESELLHARWAMLAAVGAPIPEVLDLCGVDVGEPIWWKVGAAKLSGDITINYAGIEGFRIAGKQGIAVIALCQLVLMGGPEYARYVGIKSLEPVGVFLPGDSDYPGGTPFDPLNYAKQPKSFVDQTVKEIKNGRVAMMAVLGYYAQAIVTREGPVHNLLSFLDDPVHNNMAGQLVHF